LVISFTSSVVVHDLDVLRASLSPSEADSPLIVDPDTVLAPAVTTPGFQAVARRHTKIVEAHSSVKDRQIPQAGPENARVKRLDALTSPQSLCDSVPE
jgi:hypothetical protein